MKNKFFEDKEKILEYQYNIFSFLGYNLDDLIENRKYIDCPDQDCTGQKAGFFLSREYDFYCKCNKCEKTFDVIDFFKEIKDLKIRLLNLPTKERIKLINEVLGVSEKNERIQN